MSVFSFSNAVLDAASQKPLTQENWNSFVEVLGESCQNLPVCYNWVKKYDVPEAEFIGQIGSDLAVYIAGGDVISSLLHSLPVAILVVGCEQRDQGINYLLDKVFTLKASSG